MDITEEVLKRIKPTELENSRIKSAIDDVLGKIEHGIEGIDAEPILVGSVAKGTHLKNPDVDIFIRFSTKYKREFMEEFTLALGKKILNNPVINYAEHPYVNGTYMGYDFDIVPCYRIEDSSKKITSVDRTPFHTEFVLKHLTVEGRDQVRVLKQFLKGIGVYGAEAKVQGFSGYLTELLIIKFGTFENVLSIASKWKKYTVISFKEVDDRVEYEKFKAPLIFIDPVDEKRNVASALSLDNYATFIYASREFLRNMSLKFFFPEFKLAERRIERGTGILHIMLPKPEVVDDILYPQIRKFMNTILENIQEFEPSNYHFYVDDNVHVLIEAYILDLPKVKVHEGPPVWDRNSDKFIKKWKGKALSGPYIRNGHFYADVERKEVTMESKILSIIKSNSIGKDLDRVSSMINFSRDIGTVDRKEFQLFMDKKFPWEY